MKPLDQMTKDELNAYIQAKWESGEEIPDPPKQGFDDIEGIIDREIRNRAPVNMPREYVYAAAAGGAILILTAWPVLILGAILGGFAMMKLGCPNK